MLTNLQFRNFKTWAEADIQLGRITGLFGRNSSGKTSIIQFLLMLKLTKDATDRAVVLDFGGEEAPIDLGSFRDAVHNHDETKPIGWTLNWSTESTQLIKIVNEPNSVNAFRGNEFSISADVRGDSGPSQTQRLEYKFAGHTFALAPRNTGKNEFDLSVSGPTGFRFIRTVGRPWQLPPPIKSYAFPDQARTYHQNASFLSDLELAYERQIDSIFYLGPLREYPKRDYYWSGSKPSDVGVNGKRTVEAILSATEASETRSLGYKKRRMPFQAIIAYWLREIGLIHDFRVEEIAKGSNRWIARVIARPGGTEVALTDVGFGVSQILPVITLLYYVPEGSTVILEQPEIHLHPLAQANLADLIITASKTRNIQIILESHSEHLLLRMQRRIAEEEIAKDDVALFFCESNKEASQLDRLSIDMYGRIENWPDRFMGDAFEETFRAEEARLKRMKARND